MVDFQRKGQFIYNSLRDPEFKIRDEGDIFKLKSVVADRLWNMSSTELDEHLKAYDMYLIDNQVCPKCFITPLHRPDHQIEVVYCHSCGWREE